MSSRSRSGHLIGGGKYELLSQIGNGAMGTVWLARHVALDRMVAVKMLGLVTSANSEARLRFLAEARSASLLRHANSVRILDYAAEADDCWIVMEYLEGRNLAELLTEQSPLVPRRAIAIASQMLAAVAEAHEYGIVHRDLKPANIMLMPWVDDDGNETEHVKVLDFGIATIAAHGNHSGEVAGTPEYMSPEQAQGLAVDPRSDVYAVGIVLYQMVTGEIPFHGKTALDTMLAHVNAKPRPVRAANASLSERLEAVVVRALSKDPKDRFPNARAMRSALLELPEAAGLHSDSKPRLRPVTSPGMPRPHAEPHPPATAPHSNPPAAASSRAASTPAAAALAASTPATSAATSAKSAAPVAPTTSPTAPTSPTPPSQATAPAAAPAASKRKLWPFALLGVLLLVGAGVAVGLTLGRSEAPAPQRELARALPPIEVPPPVRLELDVAPEVVADVAPEAQAAETMAPDTAPLEVAAEVTAVALATPDGGPDTRSAEVTALALAEAANTQPRPEATPKQDSKAPKVVVVTKPADVTLTPVAPTPVAPTPVAPTPVTPVAPTPVAPAVVTPPAPEVATVVEPKVTPPTPTPARPKPALAASVQVRDLVVKGSLPRSAVQRALDATRPALEQCYRAAAQGAQKDSAGKVDASVVIDVDGQATQVTIAAFALPGFANCARQSLSRARSRERPDTGTALATFSLAITPNAPETP